MNERGTIISKEYDKARYTLFAGIAFLILTLVMLGIGIGAYNSAKRSMPHLNEIIESESGRKTGKFAYLDLYGCYAFASDGSSDYYIAYDDDYYYMISMDDEAYEDALSKYEQSGDDLFRLVGWTTSIPEESIPYAIKAFNEDVGQNFLNEANFKDYFGDVCLAVHPEKKMFGFDGLMNTSGGMIIGAIFTAVLGFIMLFTGRARRKSFDKVFDPNDDRLLNELSDENTLWYPKAKTALGERHLVSYNGVFDAIDYSDIFWAYVTQHKTNYIRDYNYLHLVDKSGRQYSFANSPSFSKKRRAATEDFHNEILSAIKEKNPAVLIGYTQENLAAFNQLQQEIKENKNIDPLT